MTRESASPETHTRPHHRVYRGAYVAQHGRGPYICAFCEKELLSLEVVHHVDEDPWNNEIENLVSAHTTCHNQHHHWDVSMSDESNQQRSVSLKLSYESSTLEQRQARLSSANQWWRDNGHSEETKQRLSEIARNRPKKECNQCGRMISANSLTIHQRGRNCEHSSR